jgi:hypothetical protein
MNLRHSNGHELTQPQLDAMVPVLNAHMAGKVSKKKFEAAIEQACREAGCPIPGTESKP